MGTLICVMPSWTRTTSSKPISANRFFNATAQTCGPLVSWFPQALLYGFWQSHLGKKRANTKHARAWVSEIVGWRPASTDTRMCGVKGDPLNLNIDEAVSSNPDDRTEWDIGQSKKKKRTDAARKQPATEPADKKKKLSEIGHGQALFMDHDAAPAAVSFAHITQRATLSFAQLRRVSLGQGSPDANAAVRALLAALGLHAHQLAFGRGFALRSGAELRTKTTVATWLGADGDEECEIGDAKATAVLLQSARSLAKSNDVPLDGWGASPKVLLPNESLEAAILSTWPRLTD